MTRKIGNRWKSRPTRNAREAAKPLQRKALNDVEMSLQRLPKEEQRIFRHLMNARHRAAARHPDPAGPLAPFEPTPHTGPRAQHWGLMPHVTRPRGSGKERERTLVTPRIMRGILSSAISGETDHLDTLERFVR